MTYDAGFYETLNDAGGASAEAVLPLALERLRPSSAVDVGCGTGIWAAALVHHGVRDTLGIDGAYVPRDQLRVDPDHFRPVDIGRPFDLGRTFDMAVCVEVGEHLDEARADGFVSDLVRHAPAIVFSAATPLQGGTHHVNEQWPDYWIERFERHGFTCWDAFRPLIRYNPAVAWIYRQNLMLVLGPGHPALDGLAQELRIRPPEPGDVPFEYVARYLLEREDGLATTVRRLPRLVMTAARNRLRR
jgi:SAM-dependent methyltransferase